MPNKTRLLFFAEAVSLSHVGRAIYFGSLLQPETFQVTIATDERYRSHVERAGLTYLPLRCIRGQTVLSRAYRGFPLFHLDELEQYADEDREVMSVAQPDFILGDMRQSLAVSAPEAGALFGTLTNSYWLSERSRIRIPSHPILPFVGRAIFDGIAKVLLPGIAKRLAGPVNQLRKRHGLDSIGNDLWSPHCLGDFVFHADDPTIHPLGEAPKNHFQIGPALWSLEGPFTLPTPNTENSIVYVNLGSSGDATALDLVLYALRDNGRIEAWVATCGYRPRGTVPPHIRLFEYLPNEWAIQKADVVICNGGSTTGYQCLQAGKPFIGIVHLLEQNYSMQGFERAEVGILLERFGLTPKQIGKGVERLLNDATPRANARAFAQTFSRPNQKIRFNELIKSVLQTYKANLGARRITR